MRRIDLDGNDYVILHSNEFDRLIEHLDLPEWPPADANGNLPAIECGRVSIAREIIIERHLLGMTQQDLAERAEISIGDVAAIESGKHRVSDEIEDRILVALNHTRVER